MCSRSCVVFWTLAWIALLNSLLVTTLGWSLNPAYERRRFLRREQAQFLQSGVQPLRPEGRPLFGRRIIRSVADPPSRDASAIEDWKRELQGEYDQPFKFFIKRPEDGDFSPEVCWEKRERKQADKTKKQANESRSLTSGDFPATQVHFLLFWWLKASFQPRQVCVLVTNNILRISGILFL